MVRRCRWRTLGLTALPFWLASAAACAEASPDIRHPAALEDILRLESVGRVEIIHARFVVFERIAAPESAPNIGTYYAGSDLSAFAQLFVVDLHAPRMETPAPLFKQEARGGYWMGGKSPDGNKLAVYSLIGDQLRAGVYDFSTREVLWFDFTPNYDLHSERPVWLSESELVYAVMPNGELPLSVHGRRIAARMNELWSRAFEGKTSSATVITSPSHGLGDPNAFRSGRLVRVHSSTGLSTPIGDGLFYDLRLSPDGRHLAALREGEQIVADPRSMAPVVPMMREQLVIFELQRPAGSSPALPCAECVVTPRTLQWSAASDVLTFSTRAVGQRWERPSLGHYRLSTGELRTIKPPAPWAIRSGCGLTYPHAVPLGEDGRVAAFLPPEPTMRGDGLEVYASTCAPETRFDWFVFGADGNSLNATAHFRSVAGTPVGTAAGRVVFLADDALWAADGQGKLVKVVALGRTMTGLSPVIGEGDIAPTQTPIGGDLALLEAREAVFIADLKKGAMKAIRKSGQDWRLRAIDPATETAVFQRDVQGAPVELSAHVRGESPRSILTLNHHTANIAAPRIVFMPFKFDGKEISSCAILPAGWNAETRYPMVVQVYPDQDRVRCYSDLRPYWMENFRLLAASGYVVMNVATPRRLMSRPGRPLARLTELILAAVDTAIRHGYSDADRVGLWGESQGHHAALYVLTETDRFRAAIVRNGISNMASHYNTMALRNVLFPGRANVGSPLRYEWDGSANYLGAKPWENPDAYIRNSPVFQVDRIQTPIMIMHSDFDWFPLGQSQEIFSALHRLQKEAVYVTYWGEGHAYASPGNVRDMWNRTLDWYDRLLKGPAREALNERQPSLR